MKLKKLLFLPFLGALSLQATNFTIVIDGLGYSPANVTVQQNDVVSIEASAAHPLVQVSSATWAAGGNTELSGGFGVKTATYEFTVTASDTIFYVCQNHSSLGMKGFIVVDAVNSVKPALSKLPLIFQNPVQGAIAVRNTGTDAVNMDVYGLDGKLLHSLRLNEVSSQVTVQHPGMYLVVFRNKEQGIVQKETLVVE